MQKGLLVNKLNRAGMALKMLLVAMLLASFSLAATAQTAKADVIMPGQEHVDYCFSINNLDAYPAYVIIQTTWRIEGPSVIGDGCKESTIKNNTGSFFATRKAGFDASTLPKDSNHNDIFTSSSAYLPANLQVYPVSAADQSENLDKVQDNLRIVSISQTELQLEFVSVIYTFKDGRTEEIPYTDQHHRPAPGSQGLILSGPGGFGTSLLNLWYFAIPTLALFVLGLFVLNRHYARKVRY